MFTGYLQGVPMHRAIRVLTVALVVVTFILVVEHVTAQNGAMIVTPKEV